MKRRSIKFTIALWMCGYIGSLCMTISNTAASGEALLVPKETTAETTVEKMAKGSHLVDESIDDVAVVDIFLYVRDENGKITPCHVRRMIIRPDYQDFDITFEEKNLIWEKRRHETGGGIGLVSSDEPLGVSAVRFAAVPPDYEGKSFGLFVKGTTYRLDLDPPFMLGVDGQRASLKRARARLEIPDTLEKGKRYAVNWLLTEYVEEPPPRPPEFEIHGSWEGAVHNIQPAQIYAWYIGSRGYHFDDPVEVGIDGRFRLTSLEFGRPLAIYEKFENSGSALFVVHEAREMPVLLPRDADEVYDRSRFVEARLHMPNDFVHERDWLWIGAYRDAESSIALASTTIPTDGKPIGQSMYADSKLEGMVHTSNLMLVPGTYSARIYEQGTRLDDPRDEDMSMRLLAEMEIVVAPDGKANDFTFRSGEKR